MECLGKARFVRTPVALLTAALVTSAMATAPVAAYAAPQDELMHDTSATNYATAQQVQAGIKDGSIAVLYGKDYIDNISLKGNAWVAGTWSATVQYDSALVDATADNGIDPGGQTPPETTGATEGGVDDDFGQAGYQTYDSEKDTDPPTNSPDAWNAALDAGRDNDGKVDLLYSTADGPWVPGSTLDGDKVPDGDDTHVHTNGTYLLTVPTAIKYTGMSVGAVNTSDDYTINVTGVVPAGKVIKVTAQSGKVLDGPTQANSKIVETTSMVTGNLTQTDPSNGEYAGSVGSYAEGDNFRVVTAAEAVNPKPSDEAAGAALTYMDDEEYSNTTYKA